MEKEKEDEFEDETIGSTGPVLGEGGTVHGTLEKGGELMDTAGAKPFEIEIPSPTIPRDNVFIFQTKKYDAF